MDDKIKVVPLKIQPNQGAIEILEDMIKRVKSGEITTVGLAYTTKHGSIGGDVSKGNNNFLMWASIEHLARTFYTQTVLGEDA